MDKDIFKLAELFRTSGDKFLQGEKTLLLHGSLLKSLNNSFEFLSEEQNCDTSFLFTQTNSSKETILCDVQFLHDFIQKVVNLSITRDNSKSLTKNYRLDIKDFKSLRTLEVTRIPIQCICGIQRVRSQLQCIICVHSLHQLQDLLVKCGADCASDCVWEELSECIFSYNAIEEIDCSLLYTPFLQSIDLSHNRLKNFCVKDSLPNLKCLNLGYNLLQSIPILGKESAFKLKVLLVRNNYIENLSGLSEMKSLVELDVSCNSLKKHDILVPLTALPLLSKVNLVGNPMSFHYKHRSYTIHYLHSNAACSSFILDGRALSRSERQVVRRGEARRPMATAVKAVNDDNGIDNALSRSVSLREEEISTSVEQVQSKKMPSSKRQKQVKEAVIAESFKESEVINNRNDDEPKQHQHHLEVKRHIEELRQRFGEERWLSEHGATHLQAVLGLPRVPPPSLTDTLSHLAEPQDSAPSHSLPPPITEIFKPPHQEVVEVTPINVDTLDIEDMTTSCEEVLSSEEWEHKNQEQLHEDYMDSESEDVDEGKLFTVQREKDPSEHLLIVVGTYNIQERDTKTGRILQRWSLSTLQSCETLSVSNSQQAVCLTFNIMQRDRRSRTYVLEPLEAKVLIQLLGDVLSSRSLSEMNQVAYRCMKCSSQFSQEEDVRFVTKGSTVVCPNCNSSIVCMMEEAPLPTRQRVPVLDSPEYCEPAVEESATPLGTSLSTSQSSIGAALGGMKSCQLQVAALVHQADTPSVPPPQSSPTLTSTSALAPALMSSALSLEESITSVINTRRCDSDIEVISNPSQSSIEVIDGETRTPGRKRSSEEQQTTLEPAKVNEKSAPNPALVSHGLTESSSSGSFTDSICTTYETQKCSSNGLSNDSSLVQQQSSVRSSKINVEDSVAETEEENSLYGTEPIPTIQEMFEGLLEKVDKELAITADSKCFMNVVDTTIQYSYTDFQNVDHRLRLYFLQELLNSDEELLMVLRSDGMKSGINHTFPSLLVISSLHLWLLEVIGAEGDNPESWLQENMKLPVGCVDVVFSLPWGQGVGFRCREPERLVLMLLHNPEYTNNFLQAAESTLPSSCVVIKEPGDYEDQLLRRVAFPPFLSANSGSELQLISLFDSFDVEGDKDSVVKNGVVVVHEDNIFVTESNLTWLFPNSSEDSVIKLVAFQQLSDLVEVETSNAKDCKETEEEKEGYGVVLRFMEEARCRTSEWHVYFRWPGGACALVTALRMPWERLFGIPLAVHPSC